MSGFRCQTAVVSLLCAFLSSVLILTQTHAEESSPPHATPLTPTDLRPRLDDAALRLLDVRKASAYNAGHIPGALRVDMDAWSAWSLKDGGLQDSAYWSREIARLGIDDATTVVVYGDNVATAARAWWLLAYAGLSKVALLDGGWQAWQKRAFPVTIQSKDVAATDFRCQFRVQWLIGMDQLRRGVKSPKLQIVDSRGAGEYSGRRVLGSRPGRIPGSVHLDWLDLLDEQGCFQQAGQIEHLLESKGISRDRTQVVYCYSGARSAVSVFALRLLGYRQVKNYYRGWQQWSADPETPVAVSTE